MIFDIILLGWSRSRFAPAAGPDRPRAELSRPSAQRRIKPGSWIAPDAKSKKLLYVSSALTDDVYVYSYSNQKLVGTLTGFKQPYGLCAGKTGDVWIVDDGAQQIVEYKHGGTSPIATLSDSGEYPEGCSVDPATGNLAVRNFYSTSGNGSVSIYAHASGEPQTYSDPSIANFRFCGYDDKGNLFADGANNSSEFAFAELRKGGSGLTGITMQQKIEWPGGVQWDGKYVAVGDTDADIIYRTDGAGGKVKGSATLGNSDYVNQFWIAGKTVVAPSQDGNAGVGIYAYPAGGAPSKTISVEEPFGAAVSN
ncbi:MAG: YncE family protein [Candidatus Cybelea sp.]